MQRYRSQILNEDERKEVEHILFDRFGFPDDALKDLVLVKRGKNIYITTTDYMDEVFQLMPEIPGLRAFTPWHHTLKPTSDFIQAFGQYATRNIVSIPKDMLYDFMRGEYTPDIDEYTNGFVIVALNKRPMGVAYISARGEFINMIPREKRRVILEGWNTKVL